MNQMTAVKKSIITAVCAALCVVLPMAFHSIPNAGSIFLPMHIPVILCGLIAGLPFGLLCGLLGPLLSSLFTGMPPMAYLPMMLIELATYGAAAGAMMHLVRTKSLYADLYISLAVILIAGRVVAGIARAFIFSAGEYNVGIWIASYFVSAWPGLVIQLALIPTIVFALEKAGLTPHRYPRA